MTAAANQPTEAGQRSITLDEIAEKLRKECVSPPGVEEYVLGKHRHQGVLLLFAKRKLSAEKWSSWLAENFNTGEFAEEHAELLIKVFVAGLEYDRACETARMFKDIQGLAKTGE